MNAPIQNLAGKYRDVTIGDIVTVGNIDTSSNYRWTYPVNIPGFLDENFTIPSTTVNLLVSTRVWEKIEEEG